MPYYECQWRSIRFNPKNASDEAKESYAIGATYGASLSITALSLNDMSLNKIGIKKGLPETEDQALVYLFMASSQQNQDEYITTLNDFLEQYPNSADGYIRRATTYMGFNDDEHNALADADLKKALEVTANKSETQYNIAKLIYSYTISLGDKKPYGDWSYDKALSIIHDAMQADNQPIYTQLEGDILFAMKKNILRHTPLMKKSEPVFHSLCRYILLGSQNQTTD